MSGTRKKLQEFRECHWPKVARFLRERAQRYDLSPLAEKMLSYELTGEGKRIRPLLSLCVATALDLPEEQAVPLAGAVELIHTASLVHDDIQDQDTYRRGRLAAWRAFSPKQAINLGDLLMALALELIVELPAEDERSRALLHGIVQELTALIDGQVLDLQLEGSDVQLETYRRVATGKTGALFRAALTGPAILKGAAGMERRLALCGEELGVLFQMRDDVLDLVGEKEGRESGGDQQRKKASLVHVVALQELSGAGLCRYRELPPDHLLFPLLKEQGVVRALMGHLTLQRQRVEALLERVALPPLTAFGGALIEELLGRLPL